MKRKHLLPFLLLGILCLGLTAGCGKKEPTLNQDTQDAQAESKYAKTITVDPAAEKKEGISYQTITDAFAYVNENPPAKEEERIQILVQPGVYRQFVTLTAPYIVLEGAGDNPEDTVLTYYYGAGREYKSLDETLGTQNTASTKIAESAHDFIAENITFENSYSIYITEEEKEDYCDTKVTLEQRTENVQDDHFVVQALALRTDADRCTFKNCGFVSVQDTLLTDNYGRCYFQDCYIEGRTDFIFGSATAVFNNCQINSPERGGYVTASSAEKEAPYGFLFLNCTLTKEPTERSVADDVPEKGSFTLGRPWGALCQVIFWNCKMDDHIITGKDRYVNMKSEYSRVDCRLLEGNTMDLNGTLLDMSEILPDYMVEIKQADIDGFYSPYNHLKAKYNPSTKQLEAPDYWNPGNFAETPDGTAIDIPPYTYPEPTRPDGAA